MFVLSGASRLNVKKNSFFSLIAREYGKREAGCKFATRQRLSQSSTSSAKFALQIGKIENDKLVISRDKLNKILLPDNVADLPLSVIGIAGVQRSGKSVLMSLLIQALDKDQPNEQQLFKYSDDSKSCTEGVWA